MKKITELPVATEPLAGTEQFEVVQAGVSKRIAKSVLFAVTDAAIAALNTAIGGLTKAAVGLGAVDNVSAAALRDRSTHTGTQAISTVTGLQAAIDGKVEKVAGKQLSSEDYTSAEKTKLAGLEDSHYRGTFVGLAGLESGVLAPVAGDYADVDAGPSDPVLRYIWDASDDEWVAQAGSADPVTAAQVKTLYESNPDTNSFSDSEKSKLGNVAANATANANTDTLMEGAANFYFTAGRVRSAVMTGISFADSTLVAAADTLLQAVGKLGARLAMAFDRANHSGSQAISTVTGLQTALDAKIPSTAVGVSVQGYDANTVKRNVAQTFTAAQTLGAGVFETATAVAAVNLDLSTGSVFSKTITAPTTFTVSNPPAAGLVASFILEITNGGAFPVTWFTGAKHPGGIAPVLTVSGKDVFGFYTRDGGASYLSPGKDVK